MNKAILIGNLTRDPELRSIQNGTPVCSFTIAVNRRFHNAEAGQPEADFFRITAWRQLGENCAKYLVKGRKVCVVGPVSARSYVGNDGQTRVSLEVQADEVEFLSPRGEGGGESAPSAYTAQPQSADHAGSAPQGNGFVQVEDDELPF